MRDEFNTLHDRETPQSSHEVIAHMANNTQPNLWASLNALIYKNRVIQSRRWCSNICQIITPIFCLLFTPFLTILIGGITDGSVQSYNYPQPFNLPTYNYLLRQTFNLSCNQVNYYQTDQISERIVRELLDLQLKEYCPAEKQFNSVFIRKNQSRAALIECLDRAEATSIQRGEDIDSEIPDGMIHFAQSNYTHLSATFSINDLRLAEYHKNNGATKLLLKNTDPGAILTYFRVTEGMMSLLDKISGAFLQISDDSTQQITGSYMYMPFSGEDSALMDKIGDVLGSGLYPLGLSLLMPILLYMVVSEKEDKQIEIMKMNGLDSKHYWVGFFIVSFVLSMLSSLAMYFFGVFVFKIKFFTESSGGLIIAVMVGWAIAQIGMTSLVQIFINNSKTATIVGYILSLFSNLIGQVLTILIYPVPTTFPFPLLLYPPFALCRIIYRFGWSCSENTGCYQSLSSLEAEPLTALIILYGWFGVFILSVWLNEMVQQEYGVAKRPKAIEKLLKFYKKGETFSQLEDELKSGSSASKATQFQMNAMEGIVDVSVIRHRQEVNRVDLFSVDQALIIKNISKKYTGNNGEINKIALKPFTLRLTKGQIFGFLGPNGAGKTTLISILTGMYPPTEGNAYISGRPIGFPSTNQLIGVCPQFDILWQEMTVEQHLKFYCKLKQIDADLIESRVMQLLAEVDLTSEKNHMIGKLSGGMQRRLSIACALSGSPRVVILDQPTSGLDPYHRREIWKILQKCKRKTSIFMTSHLMDEVQFLCDRIGIISQGELRCLGDLRSLKQRFGKGYRLTVSYPLFVRKEDKVPQLVQKIIKRLNLQMVSQLETRVVLKIEKKDIREAVQLLKHEESLDWSINQPSLYDVFMHFVK